MTSATTTKRETMATAIRSALEPVPTGWSVYASPTDIVSLPAAVLGPDDPYRTPLNLGQTRDELRLVLHLFLNRATGDTALDLFDEASDAVISAVVALDTPDVAWSSMRLLGEVEVGGQPALGASIPFSVLGGE